MSWWRQLPANCQQQSHFGTRILPSRRVPASASSPGFVVAIHRAVLLFPTGRGEHGDNDVITALSSDHCDRTYVRRTL